MLLIKKVSSENGEKVPDMISSFFNQQMMKTILHHRETSSPYFVKITQNYHAVLLGSENNVICTFYDSVKYKKFSVTHSFFYVHNVL